MINFQPIPNNDFNNKFLKIISAFVMIISVAIFIYFFTTGNYHIHNIVATGCFLLLFCGVVMWLIAYLAETQKSIELTYEKIKRQVKFLNVLSVGTLWICGLCFYAGLIMFAQSGELWRYSIILFTGSLIALLISVSGLVQLKITKQHYELKKQNQEIIELLTELKMRESAPPSDILHA